MFQIDDPYAVGQMPPPAVAGTPGWFTGGNPATSTPGTRVTADWLNMLQAELEAILAAAGIPPSKTNNGQVLAALTALHGPGRLLRTVVFLTAGSTYYGAPNGTTHCDVLVVGGGGSGGGAQVTGANSWAYGGGGGGGGAARGFYTAAQVNNLLVTVGAGGITSSSNGYTGGTSSVGGLLSATGGGGGAVGLAATGPNVQAPGSGGYGVGGNIFTGNGGPGQPGIGNQIGNAVAGAGGGSILSLGVAGPFSTTATGNAGSGPGCGSSGSCSQAGGSATASLAGAPGCVIIREYA